MEVRSNRIGDIRNHYLRKLIKVYTEKEADSLLFLVLMEYTGLSKAELLLNHQQAVSESQLLKIHFSVKELLLEKPVQYVLGKTEFYGLPFIVNTKVLIPRPETEELVEKVIKEMKGMDSCKIIDIGTGSGCIAISLKKNLNTSLVTAIDVSEFALEVASVNAEENDVEIDFKRMDILDSESWKFENKFDLIVSNPPYVRESEKQMMKKNVLDFEPDHALFVKDDDPFVFYGHILKFAQKYLRPGGTIFCEFNQYLSDEMYSLFTGSGYLDVELFKDFRGNFRFIKCTREA